MIANVVKSALTLGLVLTLISCNKSEDELVLDAVKKFGVPGGTLAYVIEARGKAQADKEGSELTSEWTQTELAEDKFKIRAQLGFDGEMAAKHIYEWTVTKNHDRSEEGVESVWKLEPLNRSARKLNWILE